MMCQHRGESKAARTLLQSKKRKKNVRTSILMFNIDILLLLLFHEDSSFTLFFLVFFSIG